MMSHDFLLLPDFGGDYADYTRFLNDPLAVKVHLDLMEYIWDTLEWIPSINPSNPSNWQGHGLNPYGPTVINSVGAAKAAAIFGLWAAMLAEGSETLELTGCWTMVDGEPESGGCYDELTFNRESVVRAFRTIAQYAEKAKTGKFYVLHLGI